MQRQIRSPRYPFFNRGKFGQLLPIHRSHVIPGETMKELRFDITTLSAKIGRVLVNARFDVWVFYVPHAEVWEDFPEWIMGDETLTPPTQVPNSPQWFTRSPGQGFYTLGYEKIVNQFFRRQDDPQYVYYDGTSDPEPALLPTIDMTGETHVHAELDDVDVTIDISDGLTVSELREAQAAYWAERKEVKRSNRYEDFLAEHGVNTREAPRGIEIVGHHSAFVRPTKTVDPATGITTQAFVHSAKGKMTKRRYFPEHGHIIGVMALRPKVFISNTMPVDVEFTDPKRFPQADMAEDTKRMNTQGSLGAPGSTGYYKSLDHYMLYGEQMVNPHAAAVAFHNPATLADLRFPQTAWDEIKDGTQYGDDHFLVEGVCATNLATPYRPSK